MIKGPFTNTSGGVSQSSGTSILSAPPAYKYVFPIDSTSSGTGTGTSIIGAGGIVVSPLDPLYVRFPLINPGTSRLPGASAINAAYVEFVPVDSVGNAVQITAADVARFTLWLGANNRLLPLGTFAGIAITVGGVADIGNAGTVHGIQYDAAGNRVFFQANAGAGVGWTAPTVATSSDVLTRGIMSQIMPNNSGSSVFRQTIPIDAGGYRSSVSASSPIAAAANSFADGNMTRVAIICGWLDTTGAPTNIDLSLRSLIAPWTKITGGQIVVNPPARTPVTIPKRFLIIGDSNSNGTTVDSTWGVGPQNVQTGWVYRHNGVNATTYPTGTTPGVGAIPYIIANAITRGATTGNRSVIRRGFNGGDTTWPGQIAGQISGAIDDVNTVAHGDPEVIIWIFGANDAQNITEVTQYLENMNRAILIMKAQYPNAVQVLVKENMNDAGTYPQELLVYFHIDTLAARYPKFVKVLDASAFTNFDTVHLSQSPGGGQNQLADALFTLI